MANKLTDDKGLSSLWYKRKRKVVATRRVLQGSKYVTQTWNVKKCVSTGTFKKEGAALTDAQKKSKEARQQERAKDKGKMSNIPKKDADAPVNKKAKEEGDKRLQKEKDRLKIEGKGSVADPEEYGKTLKEHANKTKKTDTKEHNPAKDKKESDAEKANAIKKEWLDKTKNSPAAKAGFTDEERWKLQEKHRKWKADRKAGKGKSKKFDPRKGRGRGYS